MRERPPGAPPGPRAPSVRAPVWARDEWREIVERAVPLQQSTEASSRTPAGPPPPDPATATGEARKDLAARGPLRLPERPWGSPGWRVAIWALVVVVVLVAAVTAMRTLQASDLAGGAAALAALVVAAVASVRRLITATLETLLTASESPATVLRRVRPGHHDAPPGPDADDDRR